MYKKRIYIIITISILVLIISLSAIKFFTRNRRLPEEKEIDIAELENNFNSIFSNEVYPRNGENSEKLYLAYDIETSETSKYSIDANIPNIGINTVASNLINDEIFELFVKKIVEVMQNSTAYTIYNVDYSAYINENVLSIVIKSKLKEGSNPQKTIIKTYNYDMEKEKLLGINDIIELKNLDEVKLQEEIKSKISQEIENTTIIEDSGYNTYIRDLNNSMYKIENTTEYFLGKENVLYIVYAYGNTNFTNEMDLVIVP